MGANVNQKGKPCRLYRFLLQSLDPVHVGVGGHRLGRVDLPIVREPGTNIPKLPGTSLNGAIRHYAALYHGKPNCAGQGSDENHGHCGSRQCPICYTFGSLNSENGEEKGAYAGTVRIFDARILLFPVYSMAGPVWVSTPSVLNDFGLKKVKLDGVQALVAGGLQDHSELNLGWLMVKVANSEGAAPLDLEGETNAPSKALAGSIPAEIKSRIIIVPEDIFGQVVNSNLEVRTSVSIDPETGAAKTSALFTYEAIPRASIFWLDVVENNYWAYSSPSSNSMVAPINVVTSGIKWLEYLGVGGMATRGFGRLKKIAFEEMK